MNSSLRVLKWFDNKGMIVTSTFSGEAASGTKQRWDAKKKEHCSVPYPDMAKGYHDSISGVDLNDMLILL